MVGTGSLHPYNLVDWMLRTLLTDPNSYIHHCQLLHVLVWLGLTGSDSVRQPSVAGICLSMTTGLPALKVCL